MKLIAFTGIWDAWPQASVAVIVMTMTELTRARELSKEQFPPICHKVL